MYIKDEIARRSLELTRREIRDGGYGEPFLDLDVDAYRAYREGDASVLPKPYCDDPIDAMMMADVRGKSVLCLAGGGGQQSAVFSLLGANVTVLDLTPEQLERDQQTARHYGYEVTTVQGDMRDLSAFSTAEFDRVYQPISTLYVPDLSEIYRGVSRVLKPGGLYSADYAVPLLHMAEQKGWDGTRYVLHVSQPYMRGAILETDEGKLNFAEGESFAEFHHLLSDILNGLIAEGFVIRSVWENPRPDTGPSLEDLEPGSDPHKQRFLPFGLSVVCEGTGPKERRDDT
jgi:ubiquinone/menaquinone biosynthesis C-methylase UbiE